MVVRDVSPIGIDFGSYIVHEVSIGTNKITHDFLLAFASTYESYYSRLSPWV